MKKGIKIFTKILSVFLSVLFVVEILPLTTMAKAYTADQAEQQALEELLNNPVENTEDSTAAIIGEVEEKRDAYTKVYKKDDGSYTAVMSANPLHYLEDGVWKEIDNSMILQGDLYTNIHNIFNVELPKDIDSNESLTVENDGHSISFSVDNIDESSAVVENDIVASDTNIPDADTAIAQTQSAVTYNDVAENTDLQYIVTPNSIKENIIVANKESVQSTYSFTFETNGLDAVKQDDGSVVFKDNSNDVKFRIPRPVMTDNSLAFSYDIAVSLTENADDTVTLTYTPSTEWVNDANREYPIVIDPAIMIEYLDGVWLEDTFVADISDDDDSNAENYYDAYMGIVGNKVVNNDDGTTDYANGEIYTRFNIDKFKSLGNDVIFTEVQYLFTGASVGGCAYAKEIADSNVDFRTVTYLTKPSLSAEIIDYYTSPYTEEADALTLAHFNMTKAVNDWMNGKPNNGFAVVGDGKDFLGLFFLNGIYSYTNPSTNQTTTTRYNTTLIMDYVDLAGYNENLNYHSQEVGRAGTSYVNDFTQSLSVMRNDLSIDGNIMPVTIGMMYNTATHNQVECLDYESILVYGKNWLPNYFRAYVVMGENSLTYYTESGATIDYSVSADENGEIVFEEVHTDIYGEHGYELQYISESDTQAESITVTRPDGYIESFDSNGLLTTIINPDYPSQKISIVYDSGARINYITDGVGRKYDFVYDSTTKLLSKIKCYNSDGTEILAGSTTSPLEVNYAYTDGYLTSVTYPDGESISYTYDANGKMTAIGNVDNRQVAYTYGTNGKITRVTEQTLNGTEYINGKYIEYDRLSPTQIKLTDSNGNFEVYQFSHNGELLYTTDSNGNYSYATSGRTINSFIISNSGFTPHSQNLLKNSSFEIAESDISTSNAKYWSASESFNRLLSDDAQFGEYVLSFNETHSTSSFINQLVPIINDGSYTFSANIKGSSDSNWGLKLSISTINNSNAVTNTETIYVDNSDDWKKYSVTIDTTDDIQYIRVELGITNSTGTYLIDNVQLENSVSSSEYNLIENGGFTNNTESWNIPVESEVVATSILDKSAYAIELDNNTIYKTITINGKENDVYNIGGWLKGLFVKSSTNNALLNSVMAEQGTTPTLNFKNDRFAQIEVSYQYTETDETGVSQTKTETISVPFAENISDWQFASDYFILKGDCEEITVLVRYTNNLTSALISNLELAKVYSFEDTNTPEIEEEVIIPDDTETSTTTCVCGEDCHFGEGCSCTCESAENCTCSQCHRDFDIKYDEFGNLLSVSMTDVDLNEILTMIFSQAYSSTGNYQTSRIDMSGNVTQYSYNESNGMLNSTTNALNSVINYTYNEMGIITKLEKEVSNLSGLNVTSMSTEYGYDNDRISYIRRNGFAYYLDYNIWGNVKKVYISKLGELTNIPIAEYFYYDGADKDLVQKVSYGVDGDCGEITYTYNDADQIITASYSRSDNDYNTVTFEYDRLGNLAKCIDVLSGRTTILNNDGSVTVNMEDGTTVEYAYDENGNYLEKIHSKVYTKVEQETTDSKLDQTDIVSSPRYSGTETITAGIEKSNDTFHRLSDKTIMTKSTLDDTSDYAYVKSSYAYKGVSLGSATSQIDSITNTVGVGNNTVSTETLAYDYDANGNITAEYSEVNGGRTLRYRYTYDEAEQLVRFDDNVNGKTYVYKYNKGGNRVSTKEYAYTLSENLGSAVDTKSAVFVNAIWEDKMTSYGLKPIVYDSIGQVTSYDGWDYTWVNRRLKQVETDDTSISYSYDVNGLRTHKTVYDKTKHYHSETYRYIWNDSKITHLTYTNTRDVYDYDTYHAHIIYDGDEPMGIMISSDPTRSLSIQNEIYMYKKNIQGDIIGIVDDNGNTLVTYSYDAWGNVSYTINQDHSVVAELVRKINPFTYRGYNYDYEIGLYYLQSRYYNPEWGRFISADIYLETGTGVLGSNVFTYCNNNTVNMVDVSGNTPSSYAEVITPAMILVVTCIIMEKDNTYINELSHCEGVAFDFDIDDYGIVYSRIAGYDRDEKKYKVGRILFGDIASWEEYTTTEANNLKNWDNDRFEKTASLTESIMEPLIDQYDELQITVSGSSTDTPTINPIVPNVLAAGVVSIGVIHWISGRLIMKGNQKSDNIEELYPENAKNEKYLAAFAKIKEYRLKTNAINCVESDKKPNNYKLVYAFSDLDV